MIECAILMLKIIPLGDAPGQAGFTVSIKNEGVYKERGQDKSPGTQRVAYS